MHLFDNLNNLWGKFIYHSKLKQQLSSNLATHPFKKVVHDVEIEVIDDVKKLLVIKYALFF